MGKERREGKTRTGSRNSSNSSSRENARARPTTSTPPKAKNRNGNQLQSRTEVEDPEDCSKCKRTFYDSTDKMLQCERCGLWTCADCANISDEEYIVMSRPDCHWYCSGHCNLRATRAILDEKSVEDRCKEFLDKMEGRLTFLEKEITQKATIKDLKTLNEDVKAMETRIDNLVSAQGIAKSEAAASGVKEMENRDMRKKNIILFGVEEKNSPIASTRNEEDKEKLEEICSKGLKVEVKIKQVKRLGKFDKQSVSSEDVRKPRPMLAVLGSQQDVVEALKASKNLSTHKDKQYHTIRMKRDMTPLEREEMRTLVKERKERVEESKAKGEVVNWIIRNGKVIKGRPRREEMEEERR